MKHISKNNEPNKFSEWKALANISGYKITYKDLQGDEKKAVKTSLMDEQGHICCYCERRLIDDDSHIEHFIPQRCPNVDSLDYSNMLCSCQLDTVRGEPLHCENLKGGWFEAQHIISPLDLDCNMRFAYTGNGDIDTLKDSDIAAQVTIDRLGLNKAKLKAFRRGAIKPFLDSYGKLEDHEFSLFVDGYLKKDSNGHFCEFWTTIKHIFRMKDTN